MNGALSKHSYVDINKWYAAAADQIFKKTAKPPQTVDSTDWAVRGRCQGYESRQLEEQRGVKYGELTELIFHIVGRFCSALKLTSTSSANGPPTG